MSTRVLVMCVRLHGPSDRHDRPHLSRWLRTHDRTACRELSRARRRSTRRCDRVTVCSTESFDPGLPCVAFALLGLVLATAAREPLDPRGMGLRASLDSTSVATFQQRFSAYTPEWLLGLSNFDSRHAVFRSLVASILGVESAPPHLTAIAARFA